MPLGQKEIPELFILLISASLVILYVSRVVGEQKGVQPDILAVVHDAVAGGILSSHLKHLRSQVVRSWSPTGVAYELFIAMVGGIRHVPLVLTGVSEYWFSTLQSTFELYTA